MKERKVQLKFRITEKEKIRIENKAKKCGLSVSEYLRKRALGYSPKALLPESFYAIPRVFPHIADQISFSSVIYRNVSCSKYSNCDLT